MTVATAPSAPPLTAATLAALRAAVGDEHVLTDEAGLAAYSRCTIPWYARCGAVVLPGSTEEVARVVRIANEAGLPVWPFSGGRNWGYGGTLATEPGAIVLLLRRMNRIVQVDDTLAYAVIEPGVSYRQLSEHLRQGGHRLWPDCIDGTPDGSVIGNALDRGIGETPYGDHFGNLCGLEVVLPNGDVVTTGGGGAEVRTFHLHKWGVGPYVEGLFSQSNLGIVTRAGVWLMPEPECFNSFVFELRDDRSFEQVVDAFRTLALQGVLTSKLHMINDIVSMTVVTQRVREGVTHDRAMTEDERRAIRRKYGIAAWNCAGGLYGSASSVAGQRRALRRALGRYGRLVFVSDRLAGTLEAMLPLAWRHAPVRWLVELGARTSLTVINSFPHVHRILKGIPTDYFLKHAYFRNRRERPDADVDPARDRCGLLWFAPILPNVGSEVRAYADACRVRFERAGFDFYVAMLMMNPRSVICLMNVNFDHDAAAEAERARALYAELMDDMRARGYAQYRSALPGWPPATEGEVAAQRLLGRVKRALDPRGVLAPGRYGVDGRG
ncbi:MAG: FAD-dependent oxidoreductase [Rubrivivax sp.]|nr:FAD-dependent oxidoreductase [Rubrivivax sp.]